jgi:hypothetical protein
VDTVFFAGCGVAMLVGSALTGEFVLRYLIPVEPLLLVAGALSVTELRRQLAGD